MLRLHTFKGNHGSLENTYGEPEPPGIDLVRSYLQRGFGECFRPRDAAAKVYGELSSLEFQQIWRYDLSFSSPKRILRTLLEAHLFF